MLRVYTTRPDTLFGATYMVIAPEHPFVAAADDPRRNDPPSKTYCAAAARKSDLERTELAKKKTGVFTGSYAINPVNGEPIPIWVADYVLISYGTGAIMAVPAHDTRDFEFAQQFRSADRRRRRSRVPKRKWIGRPVLEGRSVFTEHGTADPFRSVRRSVDGQVPAADHRRFGRTGTGTGGRQLQTARLALQPSAVLGRAVSDPA